MPRKKFRYSQRSEPSTERSFQEYIQNQPAPQTTRTELLRLIRGGEDTYLELKVKLSNSEKIAKGIVALANTDGGTMIFGVTDQLRIEGVRNPEEVQAELVRICREEIYPPILPLLDCISYDNGRNVVVLDVEGKRRPYRTRDGRFYLRVGAEKREISRAELSDWLNEIRPLNYENIPLQHADETDFDDGLLWTFAHAFDDDVLGRNVYQTDEFLKKDLLMAIGSADEFMPTVAAVLLFGKNERVAELLPHSKITMHRYAGENGNAQLVETSELGGNLLFLYDSVLRFIERYCDLLKDKPRKKSAAQQENSIVQARGNYHLFSIREAVANTLVHRDLALREIPTRILIYDNAIEIINPRRTNGFVPPASRAIRYGITQRLNPQLASIFSKREYGTNIPKGGLPMILRTSKYFSDKRVEVYTSNDEFKLKIYGV
ncbi:MAG: putative DNA binding domain-containing protein [Acidobacteria bacterium]|jgi:ATP-dependent DNA helicase RecG|nr:putative DNA binding domain-containing protein [Acidobacteriota bacterium]MBA4184776.1 putative DNA binding domain-containing protein [Acidobacteriota bacterium]